MIIKSNATVQTDSMEITDLCAFMSGLDLPAGAQLTALNKTMVDPQNLDGVPGNPNVDYIYHLTFEWETEV